MQAIEEVFKPLVRALVVHQQHLEFFVASKDVGVFPGYEIEIIANKADTPKIYGRHRQNYNALGMIAESIGYRFNVPIKLGYLRDPIQGEAAEGRQWRDPAGQLPALMKLVENAAKLMFRGDEPVMRFAETDAGKIEIVIDVSPDTERLMQLKWEALGVIATAILAPYRWIPKIDLIRCFERYEVQPEYNRGRFAPMKKRD